MRLILTTCLSIAIASLTIQNVKAEEFTTISRFIVREGTIVVNQNSKGEVKYSLLDRNGERTEANISEAQLATKYPDLYDRFNPAVADTGEIPYAGMLILNDSSNLPVD